MVYPNPASDYASISFDSELAGNYTVVITDMSGKKLLQKTGISSAGSNKLYLDIHQLSRGMYIINLLQDNRNNKSLKLIKRVYIPKHQIRLHAVFQLVPRSNY